MDGARCGREGLVAERWRGLARGPTGRGEAQRPGRGPTAGGSEGCRRLVADGGLAAVAGRAFRGPRGNFGRLRRGPKLPLGPSEERRRGWARRRSDAAGLGGTGRRRPRNHLWLVVSEGLAVPGGRASNRGKGNFPRVRGEEAEWDKVSPARRLVIEQAIQL
jgi:hypothetical protein